MKTPLSAPPNRHPFIDLLDRYRTVCQAAWEARRDLAGPRRLVDEIAFLPAALSLQESPLHPAPRRVAWSICGLFLIALTWSIIGQVDIVAAAQGRIVVSQRVKTIQPLETSVVKAIHVRDGDRVKAGQLLVELDATSADADDRRVDQDKRAATSESLRCQALITALKSGASAAPLLPRAKGWSEEDRSAASLQLATDWSDITAKLSKLEAEHRHRLAEIETIDRQIGKLQTTLPLARQRERDIQSLAERGFLSTHAAQDRARERIELERDLATTQARRLEAIAATTESEHNAASYRAETLRDLRQRITQADLKLAQLGADAAKTAQRARLTRLTSPVSGMVQQLAIHTPGGVVTPAQALLVVVPEDASVNAEVVLENKDVGFVREGQEAEVKLETFPFTRYGTVSAHVTTITADAVTDEKRGAIFPVGLSLAQSTLDVDGRLIRLTPGMNVTAEIKTGRRRVIDYLLSPVRQKTSEALHER